MINLKAFVTGASGFVGTYMMNKLNELGMDVLGVSRNNSYINTQASDQWLCNMLDKSRLKTVLSKFAPDIMFHFAAPAFIPNSIHNPRETYDIIFGGTLNLLEAAKELNLNSKLLYVSSADVYGKGKSDRVLNEEAGYDSINPYSASKACAELLCQQFHNSYDMPIIIARPFNHTGPGQSKDFVCPNFSYQIAKMEKDQISHPVLYTGNLDVKRDFLDVRDVVEAYYQLINKGIPGEIYNVSSGISTSIREIIQSIFRLSSHQTYEIKSDLSKIRKNDVDERVGDNTKLTTTTGWERRYSLDRTLSDLLNYWRAKV